MAIDWNSISKRKRHLVESLLGHNRIKDLPIDLKNPCENLRSDPITGKPLGIASQPRLYDVWRVCAPPHVAAATHPFRLRRKNRRRPRFDKSAASDNSLHSSSESSHEEVPSQVEHLSGNDLFLHGLESLHGNAGIKREEKLLVAGDISIERGKFLKAVKRNIAIVDDTFCEMRGFFNPPLSGEMAEVTEQLYSAVEPSDRSKDRNAQEQTEAYLKSLVGLSTEEVAVDAFVWRTISSHVIRFHAYCRGKLRDFLLEPLSADELDLSLEAMGDSRIEDSIIQELARRCDGGRHRQKWFTLQKVIESVKTVLDRENYITQKKERRKEKHDLEIEMAMHSLSQGNKEVTQVSDDLKKVTMQCIDQQEHLLAELDKLFRFLRTSDPLPELGSDVSNVLSSTSRLVREFRDLTAWIVDEEPMRTSDLELHTGECMRNIRMVERGEENLDTVLKQDAPKRNNKRTRARTKFQECCDIVNKEAEKMIRAGDSSEQMAHMSSVSIKEKAEFVMKVRSAEELQELSGLDRETIDKIKAMLHPQKHDPEEAPSTLEAPQPQQTATQLPLHSRTQAEEQTAKKPEGVQKRRVYTKEENLLQSHANLLKALKRREAQMMRQSTRLVENMQFKLDRSAGKEVQKEMADIAEVDRRMRYDMAKKLLSVKEKHLNTRDAVAENLEQAKKQMQKWELMLEVHMLRNSLQSLQDTVEHSERRVNTLEAELPEVKKIIADSVDMWLSLKAGQCKVNTKTLKLIQDPLNGRPPEECRESIASKVSAYLEDEKPLPYGVTESFLQQAADASTHLAASFASQGLHGASVFERVKKALSKGDKGKQHGSKKGSISGKAMHDTAVQKAAWDASWLGACDGLGPRSLLLRRMGTPHIRCVDDAVESIGLVMQERIEPLPRHYDGLSEFGLQLGTLEKSAQRMSTYWKQAKAIKPNPAVGNAPEYLGRNWRQAMIDVAHNTCEALHSLNTAFHATMALYKVVGTEWEEPESDLAEPSISAMSLAVHEPELRAFSRGCVLKRLCWALATWFNGLAAVLESMRHGVNLHMVLATLTTYHATAVRRKGVFSDREQKYKLTEWQVPALLNMILGGILDLTRLAEELKDASLRPVAVVGNLMGALAVSRSLNSTRPPENFYLNHIDKVVKGALYPQLCAHAKQQNEQLHTTLEFLEEGHRTMQQIDAASSDAMLDQSCKSLDWMLQFWWLEVNLLIQVDRGTLFQKWRGKLRSLVGPGTIPSKGRQQSTFPALLTRFEGYKPKLPTAAQLDDWQAVLIAEHDLLRHRLSPVERASLFWCVKEDELLAPFEPVLLDSCRRKVIPDSNASGMLTPWGFKAVTDLDLELRVLVGTFDRSAPVSLDELFGHTSEADSEHEPADSWNEDSGNKGDPNDGADSCDSFGETEAGQTPKRSTQTSEDDLRSSRGLRRRFTRTKTWKWKRSQTSDMSRMSMFQDRTAPDINIPNDDGDYEGVAVGDEGSPSNSHFNPESPRSTRGVAFDDDAEDKLSPQALDAHSATIVALSDQHSMVERLNEEESKMSDMIVEWENLQEEIQNSPAGAKLIGKMRDQALMLQHGLKCVVASAAKHELDGVEQDMGYKAEGSGSAELQNENGISLQEIEKHKTALTQLAQTPSWEEEDLSTPSRVSILLKDRCLTEGLHACQVMGAAREKDHSELFHATASIEKVLKKASLVLHNACNKGEAELPAEADEDTTSEEDEAEKLAIMRTLSAVASEAAAEASHVREAVVTDMLRALEASRSKIAMTEERLMCCFHERPPYGHTSPEEKSEQMEKLRNQLADLFKAHAAILNEAAIASEKAAAASALALAEAGKVFSRKGREQVAEIDVTAKDLCVTLLGVQKQVLSDEMSFQDWCTENLDILQTAAMASDAESGQAIHQLSQAFKLMHEPVNKMRKMLGMQELSDSMNSDELRIQKDLIEAETVLAESKKAEAELKYHQAAKDLVSERLRSEKLSPEDRRAMEARLAELTQDDSGEHIKSLATLRINGVKASTKILRRRRVLKMRTSARLTIADPVSEEAVHSDSVQPDGDKDVGEEEEVRKGLRETQAETAGQIAQLVELAKVEESLHSYPFDATDSTRAQLHEARCAVLENVQELQKEQRELTESHVHTLQAAAAEKVQRETELKGELEKREASMARFWEAFTNAQTQDSLSSHIQEEDGQEAEGGSRSFNPGTDVTEMQDHLEHCLQVRREIAEVQAERATALKKSNLLLVEQAQNEADTAKTVAACLQSTLPPHAEEVKHINDEAVGLVANLIQAKRQQLQSDFELVGEMEEMAKAVVADLEKMADLARIREQTQRPSSGGVTSPGEDQLERQVSLVTSFIQAGATSTTTAKEVLSPKALDRIISFGLDIVPMIQSAEKPVPAATIREALAQKVEEMAALEACKDAIQEDLLKESMNLESHNLEQVERQAQLQELETQRVREEIAELEREEARLQGRHGAKKHVNVETPAEASTKGIATQSSVPGLESEAGTDGPDDASSEPYSPKTSPRSSVSTVLTRRNSAVMLSGGQLDVQHELDMLDETERLAAAKAVARGVLAEAQKKQDSLKRGTLEASIQANNAEISLEKYRLDVANRQLHKAKEMLEAKDEHPCDKSDEDESNSLKRMIAEIKSTEMREEHDRLEADARSHEDKIAELEMRNKMAERRLTDMDKRRLPKVTKKLIVASKLTKKRKDGKKITQAKIADGGRILYESSGAVNELEEKAVNELEEKEAVEEDQIANKGEPDSVDNDLWQKARDIIQNRCLARTSFIASSESVPENQSQAEHESSEDSRHKVDEAADQTVEEQRQSGPFSPRFSRELSDEGGLSESSDEDTFEEIPVPSARDLMNAEDITFQAQENRIQVARKTLLRKQTTTMALEDRMKNLKESDQDPGEELDRLERLVQAERQKIAEQEKAIEEAERELVARPFASHSCSRGFHLLMSTWFHSVDKDRFLFQIFEAWSIAAGLEDGSSDSESTESQTSRRVKFSPGPGGNRASDPAPQGGRRATTYVIADDAFAQSKTLPVKSQRKTCGIIPTKAGRLKSMNADPSLSGLKPMSEVTGRRISSEVLVGHSFTSQKTTKDKDQNEYQPDVQKHADEEPSRIPTNDVDFDQVVPPNRFKSILSHGWNLVGEYDVAPLETVYGGSASSSDTGDTEDLRPLSWQGDPAATWGTFLSQSESLLAGMWSGPPSSAGSSSGTGPRILPPLTSGSGFGGTDGKTWILEAAVERTVAKVQADIMASDGFSKTLAAAQESGAQLPSISLEKSNGVKETVFQSKVLSKRNFTSALEFVPASLPDGRLLGDDYLRHRVLELSDNALNGKETNGTKGQRRDTSHTNLAARNKSSGWCLVHGNDWDDEPMPKVSLQKSSASISVGGATLESFQPQASPISPICQHQSPIAQAAEAFLRNPPSTLQPISGDDLSKDISGGSLAHVSTMASLHDLHRVPSVSDVWKECMSEAKPKTPRYFEPAPPPSSRGTYHAPRGLSRTQDHWKGASSCTAIPGNGIPRGKRRIFDPSGRDAQVPVKAPRFCVS